MMWSPDGNRLAFLSSTGLWTMRPDGTDATQLREATTTSSRPPFSVSWSPDGSRLAFFDVSLAASGEASEQYILMVVDADGHHPVTVRDVGCCAGDDAVLPSVVWSPDGTLLGVATGDLGDATGIYTVHPDGSQWTERMPGNWSWLSWQPV
jgi:WD40 repeat protein